MKYIVAFVSVFVASLLTDARHVGILPNSKRSLNGLAYLGEQIESKREELSGALLKKRAEDATLLSRTENRGAQFDDQAGQLEREQKRDAIAEGQLTSREVQEADNLLLSKRHACPCPQNPGYHSPLCCEGEAKDEKEEAKRDESAKLAQENIDNLLLSKRNGCRCKGEPSYYSPYCCEGEAKNEKEEAKRDENVCPCPGQPGLFMSVCCPPAPGELDEQEAKREAAGT